MLRRAWVLTLILLIACSPSATTENLQGYWGFESLEQGVPEVLFFEKSGAYHVYSGSEELESGTWELEDGRILFSGPRGAQKVSAFTGTVLTLETSTGPRTYTYSPRCPAYNTRAWPSSYSAQFLYTGVDRNASYSGGLAADFDSEGELHAVLGRVDLSAPEPQYATTRGDGCGLRKFVFPPQKNAVLQIDARDTMHLAFAGLTDGAAANGAVLAVKYGTRPALSPDAPWVFTELGRNTFTEPRIALATTPAGQAVIVATEDDGRLTAYRLTAGATTWARSDVPGRAEFPEDFAVAIDSRGLVHVLVQYSSTTQGLAAYSEGPAGWTTRELALPPGIPPNNGFGFAIDASDRWYVAMGDIGTPPIQGRQAGTPGHLHLGTAAPGEALSWRSIGVGGRARLALDDLGRTHVTSYSRLLGPVHTVIDGDMLRRDVGNGQLNPWQPPMLATGPKGRVAFGTDVAVFIRPPDGTLVPIHKPLTLEVEGPAGAISVPELNVRCTSKCTVPVAAHRIVELTFENEGLVFDTGVPSRSHGPTVCLPYSRACLQVIQSIPQPFAPDLPGPTLVATFKRYAVSRVTELGAAAESWSFNRPLTANSAALVMPLSRPTPPPYSRLLRWDAQGTALPPTVISDWYVQAAAVASDGALYAVGRTPSNAVIGTETGFVNNAEVLVRYGPSGNVDFVKRMSSGSLGATPLLLLDDGVGLLANNLLQRISASGAEGPSTAVPTSGSMPALVAARGSSVYSAYSELNGSQTYLAHLGPTGAVLSQTTVPGVALALEADSRGRYVVALSVTAGTVLGGSPVGTAGVVVAAFDEAGTLAWRSPVAAGAGGVRGRTFMTLLSDERAVVAGQSSVRSLVVADFTRTSATVFPVYGGEGTFAGTGGTVQLFGASRVGNTVALAAGVSGEVDFRVAKVSTSTSSLVPVRLDIQVP